MTASTASSRQGTVPAVSGNVGACIRGILPTARMRWAFAVSSTTTRFVSPLPAAEPRCTCHRVLAIARIDG